MCVEFFVTKKNELLVNEIAPRVHNSGHLTMNAHNVYRDCRLDHDPNH
jgi:5-(carboxyamino)imidazole ribonucleotide synthase